MLRQLRFYALLLCTLLFLPANVSNAQNIGYKTISEDTKLKLVIHTMQNFWGNAKDGLGRPFEPKNDKERNQLPITYKDAYRVIDNTAPFAVGSWCQVDWRNLYTRYIQLERLRNGWSEKQTAFIVMLLSNTNQYMFEFLKHKPCTSEARYKTRQRISYTEKTVNLKLRNLTKGK